MVEYCPREQERLIVEYKEKIKDAFRIYYRNLERIYSFGCNEEEMKETFLEDCKIVLEKTTYDEIKAEHIRMKHPDAIRVGVKK